MKKSGSRMTDASEPKGDYEVGYGKPPKHSQFKPGQCGNPSGRPKRRRIQTPIFYIIEELKKPMVVQEGGRRRRIPIAQALAKRIVHGGLRLEAKPLSILFSTMPEVNSAMGEAPEITDDMSPQEAMAAWEAMLRLEKKGRRS